MHFQKRQYTRTTRNTRSRTRRSLEHPTPATSAEYDVVVIGGGIGGLYTAFSLLKRRPTLRVLVVEKRANLGGRIYTYHDAAMTVESGAGRYSNHHKRLRKLIRELDLSSNVVSINGGFSYIPVSRKNASSPLSEMDDGPQRDIRDIMAAGETADIDALRNIAFIDFAKQVVGETRAKRIADSFGYYSELVIMNAHDAIRLMRVLDTHDKKNRFYSLSGGLSQIVAGLESHIRSHPNARISLETRFVNMVEEVESGESVKHGTRYRCILASTGQTHETAEYSVIAKHCVFALPKPALEKIEVFRPIAHYLRQVSCGSLCRIYSRFDDKDWMAGLGKITTNNDLRMIIPIDPQKGVIMISYTDNVFADKWHSLYRKRGVDAVNTRIAKHIRETLHIGLPEPTHTKVFYWACGVGYWNVGANSAQVAKQMIRPFPHKRVFVCGEHFSEKYQQWMEGALETSETVVRTILSELDK